MAIASLNLPGYATPQALDFSPLAQLGQTYKTAAADANRQQTLASLGQGDTIDPKVLIASGDMSLANLGIQIQNKQHDQARQVQQDALQRERYGVEDKFKEQSLALQRAAAARAGEDKPVIKEVTDPNTGQTSFYRINPRTGEASVLNPTGLPAPSSGGGNPFGPGKFNEGQGKAAGFTDRMLQSEAVLSGKAPETGIGPVSPAADLQGANPVQYGIENTPYVPDVVKNKLRSTEYQQFDQAKRDFVNAQLRRESGAAISPSEFDSANKQYFPMPGDSQEVIAQKRANRRVAVESMGREAGQAYRPKATFRDDGAVMSTNPRIAPEGPTEAKPLNPQIAPPKQGQLIDGYRFKGGDPSDKNNWAKAQ